MQKNKVIFNMQENKTTNKVKNISYKEKSNTLLVKTSIF